MSTSNTDAAARNPSGSSTRSGGRSPTGSPNHSQTQRSVLSASILGVGLSSGNSLKSLNPGWQVWRSPPTSARHVSASSAASVPEASAQPESTYRSSLGDAWAPRSASGAWDEMVDSPHMKDLPQLESHSSLPLHQTRSRHVTGPQSVPIGSSTAPVSKQGQYSPQRYNAGQSRDSAPSRYSPASPSNPIPYAVSSSFPSQQHGLQGDQLQASSFPDDELSMALRGMVVADDLAQSAQVSPFPMRVPSQVQQPRMPYGSYPQGDYTAYYTGPSAHIDYSYAYDAYRATSDPSLYASSPALSAAVAAAPSMYPGVGPHPHPIAEMHSQQPGVFYDFSGSSRALPSQYYYPPQPLVYHHPMDKKRGNQQPSLPHPSQGLVYANIQSAPQPHPQAYPAPVDFHAQHPMMVPPGTVYGPMGMSPHHLRFQQPPGVRGHRRSDVDHRVAIRSPLLDEFRMNRSKKWELRDMMGHVVEFSGDQHGSRFIQQKLETATSEERQLIFDEIVPQNALQLIQDVFGNYVIQKLFEHGTQIQKTILASTMEGHILPLSLQMYGCRVVQKAVEYILPEQQSTLVQELEASVIRCVKDANGNHVIQKLIERVPPERLAFLKAFKGNVYDLATHPYGCRVLQRCFEHLPEEYTRPLIDELHKHVNHLMQDQFGNYVVQFVLEHGKPEDRAIVVSKLRGQMLHMARHKFASNVCEKALTTADPESRRFLIEEIMTPRQDGVSPILTMMKDQFANYVLQRALSVVEGDQREALAAKVRPQLTNMRRYSSAYSKHLVAIERLLERCSPSASGEVTPKENAGTPTMPETVSSRQS